MTFDLSYISGSNGDFYFQSLYDCQVFVMSE